jgi:glycosyltransferase involved in cell wall biosynthesis
MKISIITACLNAGKLLEGTIQSVLAQHFDSTEYIVIDGGSDPETPEVIKRYPAVTKYVREPDSGVYDAFNKGIRLASGDVIGILNAGDYHEPHTLQKVANAFQKNPDVDMVHGDQLTFDENGQPVMVMKPLLKRDAWKHDMPFNHPTCFIRHDLYLKLGLFNTDFRIAADYDFAIRVLRSNAHVHYIPEVLARFSYGGLSSSLIRKLKEERRILISHQYNRFFANASYYFKLLKGTILETLNKVGFQSVVKTYRSFSKRKVVA